MRLQAVDRALLAPLGDPPKARRVPGPGFSGGWRRVVNGLTSGTGSRFGPFAGNSWVIFLGKCQVPGKQVDFETIAHDMVASGMTGA